MISDSISYSDQLILLITNCKISIVDDHMSSNCRGKIVMSLLISNTSGINANTNGNAPFVPNNDPFFVQNNLLTTIYTAAANWDAASVQIYISPQMVNSNTWPVTWFAVGAPITTNSAFTFQHRWGMIKAEVVGATALTSTLRCTVFDGR